MRSFICCSCRRLTPADPRAKDQRYCGREACQRDRKRKWQQAKMATDSDYRANQNDAQQAWRERHPDYWRLRRSAKRAPPSPPTDPDLPTTAPVKMDAIVQNTNVSSGRYILTPIDGRGRKMDALRVEIVALSAG